MPEDGSFPEIYQLGQLVLYREGVDALLEIAQASVYSGQFTCITGASGAGKSSLLFALAGLNDRYSGNLFYKGAALSAQNSAALRCSEIGVIFQHFHLFDELGALANAALQSHWQTKRSGEETTARAEKLLEMLGISNPMLPCSRLSGGERQRVAVARALAGYPAVVLADEPTASLDDKTAEVLVGILLEQTVEEGHTLVACSHDKAMIERADVLWTLGSGQLQQVR